MLYYSPEDMKNLKYAFEEKVLRWPHVTSKKMFGCPCYQANGKLFAFLVTNGIVVTQLSQADKEALSRQRNASSFEAGKRIVKNWLRVSIKNRGDLDGIIPFVKKSCQAAGNG